MRSLSSERAIHSIQFSNSFTFAILTRDWYVHSKKRGKLDESHWNNFRWNIIRKPVSSQNSHRDASSCGDLYYTKHVTTDSFIISPNFTIQLRRILHTCINIPSCFHLQTFVRWTFSKTRTVNYDYRRQKKTRRSTCQLFDSIPAHRLASLLYLKNVLIFICLNVSFSGWNNNYIFNFPTCFYQNGCSSLTVQHECFLPRYTDTLACTDTDWTACCKTANKPLLYASLHLFSLAHFLFCPSLPPAPLLRRRLSYPLDSTSYRSAARK